MKIVKVAVIGVGNMGFHHARNYASLENVELVAVSDLNETRGKEVAEKFGCRYYKEYQEILKNKEVKALSIVVPTSLHKEVAIEALRARKHVLLEKPLALFPAEGEMIIREAKKSKVILAVGHIERYNPAISKLKSLIDKGDLGQIVALSATRVGLFPSRIKDTNIIIDLAVHDIDIISYLLNDYHPLRISVISGNALKTKRQDYSQILLSYKGGIGAFIQVNWITPVKVRILSITGTKGYAEVDYINQTLKFYESNYEKQFDDFGDFVVKFGVPKIRQIKIKTEEPLRIEIKAFLDAVIGKKSAIVSGQEALYALKTASLAMEKGKIQCE